MGWFIDIFKNPFLGVAASSWLASQIAKVIIYWIANKKFEIERMFGDGGMPSGHASTVCSLATYTAIEYGTLSFQFALAAIFALVVCRDAMGVRRETGKQAVLLNEMKKNIEGENLAAIKLKEFVGHTPAQVLVGGLLGIANALIWGFLIT